MDAAGWRPLKASYGAAPGGGAFSVATRAAIRFRRNWAAISYPPGDEFDEGELAGSVDGYEQAQLAFGGLHLGDVDVEIADRVGLELALRLLVARHLRRSADPVPLLAPMQR